MKKIKSFFSIMLVALMVLSNLPTSFTTVFATTADHVVISEAYGGGGNSGAQYKNDFIELYNPTTSDVDISGWTVQYASATGTFNNSFTIVSGTIKAGGYYLIKAAAGTGGTLELPAPDETCSFAMGGSGFKVQIVKPDTTVVDLVGAGSTANGYEGTKPAPAPSNTNSVQRKDNDGSQSGITNGYDTDNNGDDYYASIPTPRNSTYGFEEKVDNPTATPTSGEVVVGTKITLSTVTTGTSISYKLNGGIETEYNSPIELDEASFIDGTATINAKASKIGMLDSDEVNFTYTKKIPSSIIPISDAKTKPAGTEVRVKGIVTYSTQKRTIFMQDVSDGICIDSGNASVDISGFVGKEIDIKGIISLYGGMVQIKPASTADINITNETPTMPEPLVITIYDLTNTNRIHEGKLIRLENVQIKTIGGTGTGTYNHTITQGGLDTTLRAGALAGRNVGDFITIKGVAGYFNNPQIQANVIDITTGIAPTIETVTALPASGSTLPIGDTVTLSTPTEGATISYTLNDGAEIITNSNNVTVIINEFNAVDGKAVIKAKASKDGSSTPESTFTYTQAKTNIVTASPVGAVNKDSLITLKANEKAVIRYIMTAKVGTPEEAIGTELIYSTPIAVIEENLPMKITAYATETGYLNSDYTTFEYYIKSNAPYKNYFGQLHSHTAENSDGSGTLTEAYAYARDVAKLDFFAVTDHSNSYDTASKDDKAGTYNLGDYNKNNVKWKNGQNAATSARTDSFISIYGYEMTWSNGPGHINTFATDGFVSRNNDELNQKTNDAGLKAYYQLLKETPNSISQFNHPGKTFGNFKDFAYFDPVIDARISLIEVGNGEGAVGSGAYFTSYDEYTKALDKGWHLAPTNNQDNHKGKWGDANTARTVIYTNDLSVQGLYDSLREMRVYATEDNNLDIVYTLNDEVLGSIIDTVPEKAEFSISITDSNSNDIIETVSIITNGGKTVLSQNYDTQNAVFEETLENPASGYYYVKVVQKDGDIAVTAPIWLGATLKIGIDSLEHDKMIPATNESLKLTTKLFNNESEAVTVKSINYEIKGGSTIGNYELNANIAGNGGMYTHTQDYTFTQPGLFTVVVTAVVSQSGNDVTYKKEIEVDVLDSEKLVYVGIDASHDNEYVSGNYKASMTNFSQLAAKYNVRTVELKTSEELINALQNPKYVMMIFTVPSRRAGTIGRIPYKSYSQAEIDAVSAFAKLGKTVIVTGWGDYYENYNNLKSDPNFTAEQHMAAQQNKLLSSIGAKLRLADDEAKDDSLNGGQPQRLYLTDHNNYIDPFTEGVIDEQVFSQYGGSTIYAVDSNGNSVNSLPSNIYPIISGHATTYSSDDDKDGNEVPPKYNDKVLLMADETVTHEDGTESTVIVAGGAFMSNFEIQVEVENAGTLPYSNYNILENIILSLRTVSPIADVHEMAIGTNVIIEGTVTTDVFNGSDSNKGFFDCIYIQDSTGGINLFPVSGGVQVGQKIRVLGKVSQYQDEKQIQVEKVTVLDSSINPVAPKVVTPQEAIAPENIGSLVKFTGIVTEINNTGDGVVGQLMVGGIRVYINGYITKNISLSNIKIGDKVEVTGISSIGENMSSTTEFLPRIRVRDRAEIVVIASNNSGSTQQNTVIKITSSVIEPNVNIANGTATATILQSTIDGALNFALQNAKNNKADISVEIKVKNIDKAKKVEISLPKNSISNLAKHADNLVVTTPIGTMTFDSNALQQNADNAKGDIKIIVSLIDKDTLSKSLQEEIDDKPVYSFIVTDGIKELSNLGNGKISISVPYSIYGNEEANKIIICHLNENGQLNIIKNCNYDAKEERVYFITNHLSSFAVIYKNINFDDVASNAWYKDSVDFVTSRELFTGIEKQIFDAEGTMTRAMFVTVLSRLDGNDLSSYTSSQFVDVDINSWYGKSVIWAANNGIVKGYDSSHFVPNDSITREQMAVMFDNYIKFKGLTIESLVKNDFSDSDKISNWAKSSVEKMYSYDLINGVGNNMFEPQKTADRGSVATIFMNFIKMVLGNL